MFLHADEINRALKHHREQQAQERSKLSKHRRKCLKNPEKYIGLFMDGMDQKKTYLPHFVRVPKDVEEETFVQMHLVGCLVYCKWLQDARCSSTIQICIMMQTYQSQ